MRVLIVSQYYKPEPIPKIHELAEALQARGHQVDVVTAFPHYPTGDLYPGVRLRMLRREVVDGIRVVRTFIYPYHGRSSFGRIVNYLSFMLSAPLAAWVTRRCEVIYVWHPPLTTGVAGWLLGKLKRAPFVYDVQDIWPESAVLSGMMREGVLVRWMRAMERFVYRRAARILTVTADARANLLDKGVPAEKVRVIDNWVDDRLFAPAPADAIRETRDRHGWGGRFVVLFAGNLGLVQGLGSLLEAAGRLRGDPRFLLAIMGDGVDRARLERVVLESDLGGQVQFIPRQPPEAVAAYLSAADALVVHLRKSELARFVLPSKTLAYLSAGRPVIVAMDGPAADLVRDARAGLVVPPEEPQAMAEAFLALAALNTEELDAMGRRGRACVQERFAKEKVIGLYEELLAEVAAGGRHE